MSEPNPSYTDAKSTPKPPGWRAEDAAAAREAEVRQYLLDTQSRRDVVATTVTRSGDQLDWIPLESQTPDGKVADPPSEGRPHAAGAGDRPTEPGRSELSYDDAERGPEGTVPVRRHPIDRIRPTGDLQDWLSKTGRATKLPPPSAAPAAGGSSVPDHAYAHAYQPVTCFGTEGVINVWRPYVEWSDEFSIGQLWLSTGTDASTQTVEAGLQARKDSYGDWEPHLFIFFTTTGYLVGGDFLGGYNQDVRGWVQVSTTWFPAARMTVASQVGGQQYDLSFKVQLFGGNWWVMVNGEWMGYYPASLYGPGGMGSAAAIVAWGGETYDEPSHPGTTGTDMGSGLFPWEGFGRAAYIRNINYQTDPAGTMARFAGIKDASNTDCYDATTDFVSDTSWGSHLFFGGTGRNSACP